MEDLTRWQPCPRPGLNRLAGRYAALEPLTWQQHGQGLFDAVAGQDNAEIWRYMPMGPFNDIAAFEAFLSAAHDKAGWQTMVIRGRGGSEDILGMMSFMRIREDHGSAEVGCVAYGERLKRTRIATEALYLMARHLFEDLGYRRFEWKCNAANEASKRAALRYGFQFEGIFRNDMVVKGQNRDTAWYAMTNGDWPDIRAAYQTWLAPENFDSSDRQKHPLAAASQSSASR